METFFNIRYEFDVQAVHEAIDRQLQCHGADYICVADGVILDHAYKDEQYREIINGGMFSICDSSYVPLYIRIIHGLKRRQYCGSQIFLDVLRMQKHRSIFLGGNQRILNALRERLKTVDERVAGMSFVELPFVDVNEFEYKKIAADIEADGADIIWVSLGAPKQEIFMSLLKPHLHHGVIIAVGAAFKFYSGLEESRAPKWMIACHMEFVYRILRDPKKQLRRCVHIMQSLPRILNTERRHKKNKITIPQRLI